MTKTTQTKSKQKTYATKVKRKQRIKETNESSSIKNRDNSPYEEQQLPLRTTKIKKKNFSPSIKIGKTKQVLEKNSFEENLGGGENKDAQTILKN